MNGLVTLLALTKECNLKHSEAVIEKITGMKELGFSSRDIAKAVFGSSSKKSTVNDIVAREGAGERKSSCDNSRILFISDLHLPYHHPDSFAFLQYLKDKYQPTRVICLGDELDKHGLSYHDHDPDLYSAGHELQASLPLIKQLEEMFPVMDILESNHGSLVWRKAKTNGIPKQYIKSYNDVLGVGKGWKWHFDMTLDLPDGTQCYVHHGKASDILKLSQQMGMSAVQGHYHTDLGARFWANPNGLYFGMQCGCLIDRESYAFAYSNVNIKKQLIGTGLIIDSLPIVEPMILNERGEWKKR